MKNFNPYGIHWSEMKREDLLLIDGEGAAETSARNIHIAGHRANSRHVCLLHTHIPHATALTMLKGGRLEMAYQTTCRFHNSIAYEKEFGGLADSRFWPSLRVWNSISLTRIQLPRQQHNMSMSSI